MKTYLFNKLLLTLGFVLILSPLLAQAPQGIHFQAVARNATGVPYSSQALVIAFLVQDGGGNTVYQETHNVVSDPYGLFDAVVGNGTVVAGSFAAWIGVIINIRCRSRSMQVPDLYLWAPVVSRVCPMPFMQIRQIWL